MSYLGKNCLFTFEFSMANIESKDLIYLYFLHLHYWENLKTKIKRIHVQEV